MSRKIYKYEYGERPEATIKMPYGGKIVRVAYQKSGYGHGLMIWAEVNPDNAEVEYQFNWFKTGEVIQDDNYAYVATLENNWGMIMHLYLLTQPNEGGKE